MAGKMISIKPNAFHRLLHRIVSIRLLVSFFAKYMHRVDFFVLKLTGQKYTLAEIAGWTTVQLTATGAKSGEERTVPLLVGVDGDKLALIASSFGREHNPGWYYNLKANPSCKVTYKGNTIAYIAREVSGDEYEKYWQLVSSSYVGYEKYKKYASHRHIPVIVLTPKD